MRWITPPSIKAQAQICSAFALPQLTTARAVRDWFTKYVNAPRYKQRVQLRFTSADGVALHAVRLAGPVGCGATVVLAHGVANWHRHP